MADGIFLIAMHSTNIFNTYLGMYIVQSFFHALIATIITGTAIEAWKIEGPVVRQRFRLTSILFAVFSFPLYQAFNRNRSGLFFRLDALFDSTRWLEIRIWDAVPLHLVLLALFIGTSVIFLFQEFLPILKHFIGPSVDPQLAIIKPSDDSPLGKAIQGLLQPVPDIFVVQEDELLIFSTTGKKAAVYLSAGLVKTLTPGQLQAAVAHEMAHIARSKGSILLAGFVLRMFMFFNPIVLVEFRRAIRNEEKICDDIAVAMTGKPSALAQALRTFYPPPEESEARDATNRAPLNIRLEEYGHNLHLQSRIRRLEEGAPHDTGGAWFPFFASFGVVCVINYYVV